MSYSRTRFSPPPRRQHNEFDLPKAAWSQQPNDIAVGAPADELWGVAQRDMGKPRKRRGEKACARRRAKAAARRKRMPLKAYLRKVQ